MDVHCFPSPVGGSNRQRGFTLVEALITLGICTILLTQVAPTLQSVIQRNRLSSAVNRFSASLQYARSEAIRENRRVVLCPSEDFRACAGSPQWNQGWIIFADADGNRERSRREPLLRSAQALPADISMRSSQHRRRIRYQALGNAYGTNASFTFCDRRRRAAPKVICLSGTGRPRVSARRCDGTPIRCPSEQPAAQ